jgi:hypothetical protein
MSFTADEYPVLKNAGLIDLKKPSPTKLTIKIDRGEKVIREPLLEYVDQLNGEIAELQTQIDARLLLLADIQAIP